MVHERVVKFYKVDKPKWINIRTINDQFDATVKGLVNPKVQVIETKAP